MSSPTNQIDDLKLRAVEVAANGIAITDTTGAILWVNQGFTKLTGYTLQEALGHNPRILKSGKVTPEFYNNLWKTITSGQVWHGGLINKRKDGTLYHEEMTITPILDPQTQKPTHFIAIKQNVSAQKHTESQLNEKMVELERINQIMVDRELKMIEMKSEINQLKNRLSQTV